MNYRTATIFVSLAVIRMLFISAAAQGQLPKRLERCLPYPTFNQEIQSMKAAAKLEAAGETSEKKRIVIDSVAFRSPVTLPKPIQVGLVTELKQHQWYANSKWIDEAVEVPIRSAWQDQGYFKMSATAEAQVIREDPTSQHVALTVHVDEGTQFFLGDFDFRSADLDDPPIFTREELRKLFPLREGDIFAADKIRNSLKSYRQLYASRGYIDFAAEPEFDIDDLHRRINLTLVFDQGAKQFHIGRVEVLTLKSAVENAVNSSFRSGDVFDPTLIDRFISENKSLLPQDASRTDVITERNLKTGVANLTFDFLTCPDSSN